MKRIWHRFKKVWKRDPRNLVCLGAPLQTSLLQRWGAREREVLLQVTLRKGNQKGGRTKPNQKVTPKTRIQENKMKKENQMRNLVTRPHPRKVFAYSSRKGCVGEEPTAHTSIRVHRHQDQQDLPLLQKQRLHQLQQLHPKRSLQRLPWWQWLSLAQRQEFLARMCPSPATLKLSGRSILGLAKILHRSVPSAIRGFRRIGSRVLKRYPMSHWHLKLAVAQRLPPTLLGFPGTRREKAWLICWNLVHMWKVLESWLKKGLVSFGVLLTHPL